MIILFTAHWDSVKYEMLFAVISFTVGTVKEFVVHPV